MSLFYFDERVDHYEKCRDYTSLLRYLSEKCEQNTDDARSAYTLIAYAWYLYVENYPDETFEKRGIDMYYDTWKAYTDIGIKRFSFDGWFCFIVGYILHLHGFLLGDGTEYELIAETLLWNCIVSSDDHRSKQMAKALLENRAIGDAISAGEKEEFLELFPNDSLIDEYFRHMISQ